MSAPRKRIVPAVGRASPDRQLKKVLLPAPFGPIRPSSSPASSIRSAPSTARNAPNALTMPLASSSTARPPAGQPPAFRQHARTDAGDQHDDNAVGDIGRAAAAAAEDSVARFRERHQDDRADQRAEQRPRPAQRGHHHHVHRDQDPEPAIRIDKSDHHRVKRSGDRGERARQQQRVELVAPDRHSQAFRRPLARADGAQIKPHPAPLHLVGQRQQHREHGQKDHVIGQRVADLLFRDPLPYYVIFLAVLAVLLALTHQMQRSRMGFYLRAIGSGERAAESLGVPIRRYKLYALLLSGAFTAIAGSLYAVMIGFVDPDSGFGILISVNMVVMSALGGAGTLFGPLVGAIILVPLSEASNAILGGGSSGAAYVAYGVIIMLIARFSPGGLAEGWRLTRRRPRRAA